MTWCQVLHTHMHTHRQREKEKEKEIETEKQSEKERAKIYILNALSILSNYCHQTCPHLGSCPFLPFTSSNSQQHGFHCKAVKDFKFPRATQNDFEGHLVHGP